MMEILKSGKGAFAFIAFALLLALPLCKAEIPGTLNVHGKLTDGSGSPLTGTYNMSFAIYDVDSGGSALWELADTNVTADAGIYSIVLTSISLPFSAQYYLGITVANDSEMEPRINLTSSPYAFRANSSDNLEADRDYVMNSFNTTNHSNVQGFLQVGNDSITSGYGITGSYGGGLIINGYYDGYGRCGGMYSSRGNTANEPFITFSGYDLSNPWEASGQLRQIWFGGTYWGTPDANDMLFFTSPDYSYEDPSAGGQHSILMARMYKGSMWIGSHDYAGTLVLDPSIPRYKLDVGDGDARIRDSSNLGFGGDESSDYLANIYYDGTNLTINGTPVQITGDLTAPNICYSNGTGCGEASNPFDQDLNTTSDVTFGSINVTGSTLTTVPYAEMWYHNDTGISMPLNTSYQTFTNFDSDTNGKTVNGFTYVTGGKLNCTQAGLYQAQFSATGTGVNNHEYHLSVFVNETAQYNTNAHSKYTNSEIASMYGQGFIRLGAGDLVTIRIKDISGTGTGTIYTSSVNLVRIGN